MDVSCNYIRELLNNIENELRQGNLENLLRARDILMEFNRALVMTDPGEHVIGTLTDQYVSRHGSGVPVGGC